MTATAIARRALAVISLSSIMPLCTTAHAGAVSVSFVDAARYTDGADGNLDGRDVLRTLARELHALGSRYLPRDQALDIQILNIDLAGEPRYSRTGNVRVMMGDADWPRLELRYTLRNGGTILQSGRETIVDHAYVRRLDSVAPWRTPLPYETRMVEEWFVARFSR